jgi:hypothetical protein
MYLSIVKQILLIYSNTSYCCYKSTKYFLFPNNMNGFNRQYTIFVPLTFGVDQRMMYSVIPHKFTVKLRKKLGEHTSKSILNAAIRRANVIMEKAMKNYSHIGYQTNNNNISLAYHLPQGRTYRRFARGNHITNELRNQKHTNGQALLNTRPNSKKGNNLHSKHDYNTGVLVRYSVPMGSQRS